MKDSRKLMKPLDLVIIAALIVVCLAVLYWLNRPTAKSGTAEIRWKGTILRTIDLDQAGDSIFRLEENPKVGFQIKDHTIRFIDTDCPDKLCENVGYISHPPQTAICLPNQVTLQIVGEDSGEPDAVVN